MYPAVIFPDHNEKNDPDSLKAQKTLHFSVLSPNDGGGLKKVPVAGLRPRPLSTELK